MRSNPAEPRRNRRPNARWRRPNRRRPARWLVRAVASRQAKGCHGSRQQTNSAATRRDMIAPPPMRQFVAQDRRPVGSPPLGGRIARQQKCRPLPPAPDHRAAHGRGFKHVDSQTPKAKTFACRRNRRLDARLCTRFGRGHQPPAFAYATQQSPRSEHAAGKPRHDEGHAAQTATGHECAGTVGAGVCFVAIDGAVGDAAGIG